MNCLFLISCCKDKEPNGNQDVWDTVRRNVENNFFRVLDNTRLDLTHFYQGLTREKTLQVYKIPPGGKQERVIEAWKTNKNILASKTMPAIERYCGKFYANLDEEVRNKLLEGKLDNILIVSALFGMLKPTDKIPNYELIMKDRSPNNIALKTYWRKVFSTQRFRGFFRYIMSDFSYVYSLMGSNYIYSVKPLLQGYEAYYFHCGSGFDVLRKWAEIMNRSVREGIWDPRRIKDIADEIGCVIRVL